MEHDGLIAATEALIDEIFDDSSVSVEETADDLEDLIDYIQIKIDSLYPEGI